MGERVYDLPGLQGAQVLHQGVRRKGLAECKNKHITAAPSTHANDSKKEKGDSSINPPLKNTSGLKKGFLL